MLIHYLLLSYLKVRKPQIDMEAFDLLCNSIHLLEKAEKPLRYWTPWAWKASPNKVRPG